jgi:uncharacterized protein YceK
MKRLIVMFIAVMMYAGCATTVSDKSNQIRYVNMRLLVDTLASDEPGWTSESRDTSPASVTGRDAIKRKLYPLIDRALKECARRNSLDMILTLSEGVVYADPRLDITGEVLSEARTLKMRNDPLSR